MGNRNAKDSESDEEDKSAQNKESASRNTRTCCRYKQTHKDRYKDAPVAPVSIKDEVKSSDLKTIITKAPVDYSSKPIVWVLGGPGSGKGTQCEKIIAKYGFTHLSTGDLLRAEVKSGSDRAKTLTAIMERGELVPNEVVLDLLKEAIQEKLATSNGFLIDGYPREESQGVAFEKAIAPVTTILYFEASSDTLTKRLLGRAASSGRADDNEDTIKLRLKTFLENNDKVLAQYPNKLVRLDAERAVDQIFADVEKALDPLVKS